MSNTAWIVLGAVAALGAYLYYRGKMVKAQAEVDTSPLTALNTLASKTPDIIKAFSDPYAAEYTTVEDGYMGYY